MRSPYSRTVCQSLLSGLPPLVYDSGHAQSTPVFTDRTLVSNALAAAGVQDEQARRGVVLYDSLGPFSNVHILRAPRKYVILAEDLPEKKGFTQIKSWSYRTDGVLHAVFAAKRPYRRPDFVMPLGLLEPDDPRAVAAVKAASTRAALTIDDVRMVTCDSSVVALGISPAGFRPGDGLFLSAAIVGELARFSYATLDGDLGVRWESLSWIDPVPVDDFVLEGVTYFNDFEEIRPKGAEGEPLNGVDVLCAATAAAYGVPLYTARPAAYAAVKRDIELIEYVPDLYA